MRKYPPCPWYLHAHVHGVAALPSSAPNERVMRGIVHEVVGIDGTAHLVRGVVLGDETVIVGIDLGLIDFLVTDTGQAVPNPRPLRKAEERLAQAQRSLQRKKRGSHRRAKQRLRFARQCQRVANTRKDFHHKTALALVQANDTIYHEDLAVKNMVQNHCLARSIHDAAWSQFIAILAGKAEGAGRQVIAVSPRGTSQTCFCGEKVPKDLSERWHDCPSCGLSLARDQVSAMLIKGLGRSLQAHAA